jgi:lysophospholipase L1-like esterase
MRVAILYCFLLLLQHPLLGQDSIANSYTRYPFVIDSLNVIRNGDELAGFYANLFEQRERDDRKISIVHIGDSHVQGDYMTTIVRNRLQKSFGNAGRGLIVPCRVAGTNEPPNFRTSASGVWTTKRCVYPDQPLPIGVGGITLHTTDQNARLEFSINESSIDHRFNRITLFHQRNANAYGVSIRNDDDQVISPALDTTTFSSRYFLPSTTSKAVIETSREDSTDSHLTIFGINLENGLNGLLYHAIGVNGAKYAHYNRAALFADQLAALKPSLCIISLGTNESLDYPYINKFLEQEIDALVRAIQVKDQHCKILLVTPQQNLMKGKANVGVSAVRNVLLRYAVENGLAFWDWYAIAGSEKSPAIWRQAGLLRSDGVHLSKDGYAYQGHLLYHAIMRGYEKYVSDRHP